MRQCRAFGHAADCCIARAQGLYFTGDGCRRDERGYYTITGRVDDVINVSGHRVGTAEVEAALSAHGACIEAAVVGWAAPLPFLSYSRTTRGGGRASAQSARTQSTDRKSCHAWQASLNSDSSSAIPRLLHLN